MLFDLRHRAKLLQDENSGIWDDARKEIDRMAAATECLDSLSAVVRYRNNPHLIRADRRRRTTSRRLLTSSTRGMTVAMTHVPSRLDK